jgi:nucleotide-binding universal stress UspA family protein
MPPTPCIIVPVEVLEGEVVPESLVDVLSAVPVVLLGYERIPEQTAADQARSEYGEQAEQRLEDIADAFESRDGTVETRLAFTHDVAATVQQAVEDVERGVVLHADPVQSVDDVLVAVRDAELVPAIAATVASTVGPTDATITLLYVTTEDPESGASLLDGVANALEEAGIDAERISRNVELTGDPEALLVEASKDHDLVVFGQDDSGVLDWLFRGTTERVADETLVPVLVVQRPRES